MIVHFLDVVSRQGTQTSKVSAEQTLLLGHPHFHMETKTLNRTPSPPIPPSTLPSPLPKSTSSPQQAVAQTTFPVWQGVCPRRPEFWNGPLFTLQSGHVVGLTLLRFHGCSCTMLQQEICTFSIMYHLKLISFPKHQREHFKNDCEPACTKTQCLLNIERSCKKCFETWKLESQMHIYSQGAYYYYYYYILLS